MRENLILLEVFGCFILFTRYLLGHQTPRNCRLKHQVYKQKEQIFSAYFIIRVTFELQCEFLTHISVIWWLHETAVLLMIGAVKA